MSTTESFIGLSIRLNEDQQNINQLHYLSKHELGIDFEKDDGMGYTDIYELMGTKNKWIPAKDEDGVFGFIYLTESEKDVQDMESYISIKSITIKKAELKPEISVCCEQDTFKVFHIIWYNGVENPFKF